MRTNAAINNSGIILTLQIRSWVYHVLKLKIDRKRKQESPIESSDNSNKRICFCLKSKTTNSSSDNISSRKNFSHSKPDKNFNEICKSFELDYIMGV